MEQLKLGFEQTKRIIILSLQPDPYSRILAGTKKHEFRRKFLTEAVGAFIYVSSPTRQIKAYLELGRPIYAAVQKIAEIAESEGENRPGAISAYLKGLEKGFAIPVLSIQEIEPIRLAELRSRFSFTAPQSYQNLATNPLLQEELLGRLFKAGRID